MAKTRRLGFKQQMISAHLVWIPHLIHKKT